MYRSTPASAPTASSVRTAKPGGQWFVTEDQIFDTAEVRRILTYLDRRRLKGRAGVQEWITVALPLNTGLRVSEVSRLTCGNLYLTEHCPVVHVVHGKGGKSRTVKISQEFSERLKWFLTWKVSAGQDTGSDAPLIVSRRRRSLSVRSLQDVFKRVLDRIGIRKRNNYHMARHTFATHLLKASNRNLVFVRDQIGHSSISVTEIYLHVIPGEDQKALERLYK